MTKLEAVDKALTAIVSGETVPEELKEAIKFLPKYHEPTDKEKRKWKSYNKYCRRLAELADKHRLDCFEVDHLLGYWSQVLCRGKAYPEYKWTYLCIRRIVRAERGLTVTDVPYLEDFLKEVE